MSWRKFSFRSLFLNLFLPSLLSDKARRAVPRCYFETYTRKPTLHGKREFRQHSAKPTMTEHNRHVALRSAPPFPARQGYRSKPCSNITKKDDSFFVLFSTQSKERKTLEIVMSSPLNILSPFSGLTVSFRFVSFQRFNVTFQRVAQITHTQYTMFGEH